MALASNNSGRPARSLTEEFKQEVREMLAEGLSARNVARYLGVSDSTVLYIQDPDYYRKKQREYYQKKRERDNDNPPETP